MTAITDQPTVSGPLPPDQQSEQRITGRNAADPEGGPPERAGGLIPPTMEAIHAPYLLATVSAALERRGEPIPTSCSRAQVLRLIHNQPVPGIGHALHRGAQLILPRCGVGNLDSVIDDCAPLEALPVHPFNAADVLTREPGAVGGFVGEAYSTGRWIATDSQRRSASC